VPPRLAAGRRSVAPVPAPVAVFRRRPARAGEAQDEAMPMLENPFHLHRDSLQVSEAPQRGALRIAFRFDASSAGRASLRPADALPAAASAHERPGLGADSAAAEAVIVSTDAAFESGIGQSCELEWALRTGDRALATAEAEEGRRRLFLAVDLRIGSAVASAIAWERTVLAVCPVASPLVAAEEASDTAAASAAGETRSWSATVLRQELRLAEGGGTCGSGSAGVDAAPRDLLQVYGIAAVGEAAGTQQQEPCVVCMTDPRDTVTVPCFHCCVCGDCAARLRPPSGHCPLCRQPVLRLLRLPAVV